MGSSSWILGGAASLVLVIGCEAQVTVRPVPGDIVDAPQPLQDPARCQACHPRQYAESLDSTMSGYRSVSPLMNGLELAGNFLAQRDLDDGAIQSNLRPVYGDRENAISAEVIDDADEARSAFCIGCHNPAIVLLGEDEGRREVPEWTGVADARPLRDFHFVDEAGAQILPAAPGGPPPPGARPSLGAHAVSCDVCHNVWGPDRARSLTRDGYANGALDLRLTRFKTGGFLDGLPVGPHPDDGGDSEYHFSTYEPSAAAFIRSSDFCNACHDVRVPNRNLLVPEGRPSFFRLENLGTEWRTQGYADPSANPFGQVVRCQDCHMSLYPYAGDRTYEVTDPTTGQAIEITSPEVAVFPTAKAAAGDDPTGRGLELPDRQVVTHRFTGVDVPLMTTDELLARIRPDYPSVDAPGEDAYGVPNSLATRREDLLRAAVRLGLDRTDEVATLGERFDVRVTAVALTGHNFPAGFSQERSAWIQLTVAADTVDGEEFVLYQSGYQVDKPHPETGELAPDGNLDDEGLEHLTAVVDPLTHHNEVFEVGPDAGPLARIFTGDAIGLVLLRNELIRLYGPPTLGGRPTGITNPRHPRTGELLDHVLEEETFSAPTANGVDNWRALLPLVPRTYRYAVDLPSKAQLAELGVQLTGNVRVKAALHFQHFPPLFLRFLARVTGASGPAGRDFELLDERRIDEHLEVVRDIAVAECVVELGGN